MRKKKKYQGVTLAPDRHGKLRSRFRKIIKGKRIDVYLPGEIGSDEFLAALQRARSGEGLGASNPVRQDSYDFLIQTFKQSPSYGSLAASSRRTKDFFLNFLSECVGTGQYKETKAVHVESLMGQMKGPTAANRLRQVMAELFDHAAKRLGFERPNPARLADSVKIRTTGHHSWNDAEIEIYRAAHPSGTKARLALELLYGSAAARSDVVAMTRANLKDGRISYRRQKTDVLADLPITIELARELEQLPADQFLLLVTRKGTAYPVGSFAKVFANWCKQAGLKGCSPHGLRKARATLLAEAGASENEVAAFLAHARPQEAGVYTNAANRATLADNAASRAENKTRSKVVQPFVQPKREGS